MSLLDLADITEEGVTFQAPTTGERMLLTPEKYGTADPARLAAEMERARRPRLERLSAPTGRWKCRTT